MRKKNLVLTLAITLVVGLGATAYAATTDTINTYCQGTGTGSRIVAMSFCEPRS